ASAAPRGDMLVMRRRAGESILIGDDIEIQIMHIGESRIKLGIIAPKSVSVTMKEVALVRQENLAAAGVRSVAAVRGLTEKLTDAPARSGATVPAKNLPHPREINS